MADRTTTRAEVDLPQTLPLLLRCNCRMHPHRVAMRKKDLGIWNSKTWEECYKNVKLMSLGLDALGFERGDKTCIIGDNDPEWYWAELAVLALGGITVGLYIDAVPSDLAYIVGHSECRFAFAKDQEQVDKFLEIKDQLPKLERIIYWDPNGMSTYRDNPALLPLPELITLGEKQAIEKPDFFENRMDSGKGNDLALISYTSGTTGLPKGAMITHDFLIKSTVMSHQVNPILETDDYLSFAPPAWIAEQLMITAWLAWRMTVNFPEAPETIMENIREIGPQCLGLGPRQWQGLHAMTVMKINDAHPITQLIYRVCLSIGYKTISYSFDRKQKPPPWWRLLYKVADYCCLLHIRDHLGLRRTRLGITGGSALGPDVFRWFHVIGVCLKEMYGLTEINPIACHADHIKPGTVGPTVPGMKVKISEDGEILVTTDVFFKGYYKQPDETSKTIVDGWVRTGDAGTFDDDGHLIIYDRLNDMLILKSGDKYSPSYIENRLKFNPYIKDVMIVGGQERDSLFAIINIDFDNVGKWAEKHQIHYTTFVDLSQKNDVYDLIQLDIDQINTTLPENARVRRFNLLPKEFDPDEGELTKTRKLRRSFLEERYSNLIDAAYRGDDKIYTEAEVKYRDGRKGVVRTEIFIRTTH